MKYEITPDLLRKIAGVPVNKTIVEGLVKYLAEVMDEYQINTRLRVAHFLGQLAHESAHFGTLEEYASGAAYEGRRDLGNTKRGDGRRYKGRGPIQITGRFNYRKYGNLLGVDLENDPELALKPEIGVKIAALFWDQNGLNEWADKDNIKVITRRINGGYNGLQDRINKVERAKKALSAKTPNNAAPVKPAPVKTVDEVEQPKPVEITTPLPVFVQNDLEQTNES